MQLRKLLLPGLLSVTLLSGCSLFNSEEDVVKMSPLPTVENQFTPTTAWSTSVGSGIGNFYSNLHPALRVQVQLKQADAALKTLDTIKGEGWAAIVADLRGEALLSKGDKQGARSAWEAGVKSDVTPALSEMMQMKINNLSI